MSRGLDFWKLHRKCDTDGGVKPPGLGLLDWHYWSDDLTARSAVSQAKLVQTRRRRPGTHHGGRRAFKASMEPTVCPVVSDVRGSHERWSKTSRVRWADPDAASAVAWRVERRRADWAVGGERYIKALAKSGLPIRCPQIPHRTSRVSRVCLSPSSPALQQARRSAVAPALCRRSFPAHSFRRRTGGTTAKCGTFLHLTRQRVYLPHHTDAMRSSVTPANS